jgi:hypothetical protein
MHFQSALLAWSIVVLLYEMLTTGWMFSGGDTQSYWIEYHTWYYQFELVSFIVMIGYTVVSFQNHAGFEVALSPFKIILVLVGPVLGAFTGLCHAVKEK